MALVLMLLPGCGTRQSDSEILTAARAGGDPNRSAAAADPVDGDAAATQALPSASAPVGLDEPKRSKQSAGGAAPTGASGISSAPAQDSGATKTTEHVPAKSASCTSPGAPLVIGQVGSFSGVVGGALTPIEYAVKVWSAWINAQGGVACHPIVVHTVDDGGDTSKAAAAAADLVENKGAVAFVGVNLALTAPGVLPYAQKHKIPVIAGEQAGFFWTENSMFFPVGGTFEADAVGGVAMAVRAHKLKFGLVYCAESTACTNFKKVLDDQGYAKRGGVDMVYSAQASMTQPSFTATCQSAKSAGVETLFLGFDAASTLRLVRDCDALGWKPYFVTASVAANEGMAGVPALEGLTIVTQTAPWMATDTEAIRQFRAAFDRYAPNVTLGAGGVLGWAGGQMLAAALGKLGQAAVQPVTSEMILRGLGQMRNETLNGLVPRTSYSPNQQHAAINTCFASATILKGKWVASDGSRYFC